MREPLLTTCEAATYLGTSPRTLEDWRLRGGGPVYRKVGRRLVRYIPADLERFVEEGGRTNTGGGRPE
jgi:excisionase family DNA binding protein